MRRVGAWASGPSRPKTRTSDRWLGVVTLRFGHAHTTKLEPLRGARGDGFTTCELTKPGSVYSVSPVYRHIVRSASAPVWLLVSTALLTPSCAKSTPAPLTADFARRNSCPAGRVETSKEGPDRMRISGCGKSEVLVRDCASRTSPPPGRAESVQAPEAAARSLRADPAVSNDLGCAWSHDPTDRATTGNR